MPVATAPVWEAIYNNDTERLKRTTRKVNQIDGMESIFDELNSDQALDTWSWQLGYRVDVDPTMHGGGVHVTSPGGWLSTHLDYDLHPLIPGRRRAINLIQFLNPEWREEWGGALVLYDPMGQVVKRIYPVPGRLAAFEVNDLSYHGVEPVTGPVERVTAAVYFLAPAAPHNTRRRAMFFPNRVRP